MAQYSIFVKTGNECGHSTDSDVHIILHGNDRQAGPFNLRANNRNAFDVGNEHTFLVQDETILDKVQRIELWREGHDLNIWYVDCITITIVGNNAKFLFVVHQWMEAAVHYTVQHRDACLPQNDPALPSRRRKLMAVRDDYQLTVHINGLPAQVADLPNDETFSFLDQFKFGLNLAAYTAEKDKLLRRNGADWTSFENVNTVYSPLFGRPQGSLFINDDASFGRQRLNGVNASLLERCDRIPAKFRVNEEMIRPFLQTHTLQWTMTSSRLFIIDLEIMQNCPTKPECRMTCPIALFYFNDQGSLMPIAIQLFQNPGENNPVFLPDDPPLTWMAAKMWYSLADSTYHQAITHLTFTHLMMEGISVASHRNLSPKHPIMKLLKPHFQHLMAINSLSLSTLIQENGIIDNISSAGIAGHFFIIERSMAFWRLDIHGTLPADLNRRGVSEPEVLKGAYYMRDDGLLLYNAIKNYVLSYVRLYYANDDVLVRDEEIQNWRTELVTHRDDNGVGILGVPGGDGFTERNHLVKTLTAIIYTCSAGHAAANFQQYDEYGAPFNYPYYLSGNPPRNKMPLNEQEILGFIANKDRLLQTMSITKILSAKPTKGLGEFEVNSFVDPQAIQIVQRFQKELADVGKEIDEKNTRREYPFKWLHPRAVPNSIEI